LNCREFVDFLMAYLDGELEQAPRSTFECHMSDCPSCETYLRTYEETIRMGRKACEETDALPGEVPEELVQAILAARQAR